MIANFLWEGKRAKIAYKKLIRSYEDGGLKLFDLEQKDISYKVKWVQVIKQRPDSALAQFMNERFPVSTELLWDCNITTKDIDQLVSPCLLSDIWKAWARINYRIPTSKQDILRQVLWFNSNIRNNKNKVILFRSWYMRGINTLQQLVNGDQYKECATLWREFGKVINIIDLTVIRRAIPKEWLSVIKHGITVDRNKPGVEIVKNSIKCTSIVYDHLNKKGPDASIIRAVWENRLGEEITDNSWKNMYVKISQLTLCTKLRFFQYRLVNNYLVTNVRLSKYTNIPAECTFCKDSPETTIHLFCECKHVVQIWKTLAKWLKYFCMIDLEPTKYVIILNVYKDSFPDMVNTILLITKYYIYVQRCLKNSLSFTGVLQSIQKYKRIEEMSAVILQKSKKIKTKWQMYDML